MEKRDNIYENDYYSTFSKKSSKIKRDNTRHYPNKKEGSLLRKIMASTGLSEEEVRLHEKYRKMLSEAQKSGQKPQGSGRFNYTKEDFYKEILKDACKETGLVPQHPKTIVVIQRLIDEKWERESRIFRYYWMNSENPMSAENAVKEYAK